MNLKEAQKRAAELEISGRSKMNKDALLEAIEAEEKRQAESLAKRTTLRPTKDRTSPTPMSNVKRTLVYEAQNGSQRLTARQERRLRHKEHRAHGRYVAGRAAAPAL